jgi:hypothetical protein
VVWRNPDDISMGFDVEEQLIYDTSTFNALLPFSFGNVTSAAPTAAQSPPCNAGINKPGATKPTYASLNFRPSGAGEISAALRHPIDALRGYNFAQDAILMTQIKFGAGDPAWNNPADAFQHDASLRRVRGSIVRRCA